MCMKLLIKTLVSCENRKSVMWCPTWGSKTSDNQQNSSQIRMSKKLERPKLKRRGQRGVITKLFQEANSLLEADPFESSSLRHLKTIQGMLREKQTVLKMLDEEIIDMCPMEEVEKETIEAKDLSGTVMECVNHISSVISEKTEKSRLTSPASRELKLIEAKTVRTNNNSTTKAGAPALDLKRSGSPPLDSMSEHIIAPTAVVKPKLPRIELPKFSG